MDSYRMFVFLVIYLLNKSDAQFISEPGTVNGCLNTNVTLSWNISNYETVLYVTWKKGAATIMSQSGQDAAISTVSNIKHGGNGAVIIKNVQSANDGEYSCEVLLASGAPRSSTATLSILVAPSYPPLLESVVEENSIKHKCVLDSKGTPEVDVKIMIGSDEISTDTHSVSCGNVEDISGCVSGDAVTCLTESSVTKRCWKIKGEPDCILWKLCIAVMIISACFLIAVIIALRICIFRKLSPSSVCDRVAVTWRYLTSFKGLTWLRVTIRVAVVTVIIDLVILGMVIYILWWCLTCKEECTLDKCSDTWREVVLIACVCLDAILYIVIIIITINCNKYLERTIGYRYVKLLDRKPCFKWDTKGGKKQYQSDLYKITKGEIKHVTLTNIDATETIWEISGLEKGRYIVEFTRNTCEINGCTIFTIQKHDVKDPTKEELKLNNVSYDATADGNKTSGKSISELDQICAKQSMYSLQTTSQTAKGKGNNEASSETSSQKQKQKTKAKNGAGTAAKTDDRDTSVTSIRPQPPPPTNQQKADAHETRQQSPPPTNQKKTDAHETRQQSPPPTNQQKADAHEKSIRRTAWVSEKHPDMEYKF